MSEEKQYDLLVIGSGPAGYIAAIRGAQLGYKVACAERYPSLGGTCLNVGCIPSKALLESSQRFAELNDSKLLAEHGLAIPGAPSLDLSAMMGRKSKIVKQLTDGVAFLFKKNKIDRLIGHASFKAPGEVEIVNDEGSQVVKAKKVLIATGSKSSPLPLAKTDGQRIITSTEALALEEVPEHLVIIGAGVIGLEMGSIWSRLGAQVTVLEFMPKILGAMDSEICRHGERLLKRQGIKILTQSKVTEVTRQDEKVALSYEDKKGQTQTLQASHLLVAVGRRPYTDGLGLDVIGLELDDRGRIPVDGHYATAIQGVYAVGDVIAGPMLAHKAEHEAVAAVERMAGVAGHVNYDAIPYVTYTHPEIAGVGKSEDQLKEEGLSYNKGTFPFSANGRAKSIGETQGLVKILADAETDALLGAHAIGPHAGDLLQEIVVAMEFGGSAEDIARSSHAHPSLSEVVKEAALAVADRVLNG